MRPKPAQVRQQPAATASWSELLGNGAIRRLQLSRGQIDDDAFKGSEAEGIGEPTRRTATSRSSISTAPCSTLRGGPQPARRQPVPRTDGVAEARRIRLRRARRRRVFLQGFRLRARWHLRSGPTAPVRRHHQLPRPRLPAPVGRLRRRHAGVPRDGDLRRPRQPAFRSGSPWTLELLVRRQTGPVAGYSPASSWPARRPRNTWSGRNQRPRNWPPWKRLPGRCGCGSGTRRASRSGSSVPPSSCSWRSSSSRTAWCDGRA